MINAIHGITKEPFNRNHLALLPQQQQILDIIKIHAQQGGFSVAVGPPGVGKSVLKEHIENLANERDTSIASCARTMHTYLAILKQLAESFKIQVPDKQLEKELIKTAFERIHNVRSCIF